jgi:nicotinate-nucleotide pyrophosphorylase
MHGDENTTHLTAESIKLIGDLLEPRLVISVRDACHQVRADNNATILAVEIRLKEKFAQDLKTQTDKIERDLSDQTKEIKTTLANQTHVASNHEGRIQKLETNQKRAIGMGLLLVAAITAAYHACKDWVMKKLGFRQ